LASSLSPYHEGRYLEQRLRSSSEGAAGSGRMVLKPKEGRVEASSLRKPRAGSSSSKMNSLDVLNHLGSCELDEDDLMLDLEFLEEQNLQPPESEVMTIFMRSPYTLDIEFEELKLV
ncbi:hypothetical protein STEG23_006878, partial [Scotinomys teguina]